MSNEQMAQSILQFTGGKGNIRMVSNCMTRVRLEVNDLSVVQIDQIKALEGVFGVHVDAQVQVIVGPGTAAKVAACLQELVGGAHKAAGQALNSRAAFTPTWMTRYDSTPALRMRRIVMMNWMVAVLSSAPVEVSDTRMDWMPASRPLAIRAEDSGTNTLLIVFKKSLPLDTFWRPLTTCLFQPPCGCWPRSASLSASTCPKRWIWCSAPFLPSPLPA